MTDIYWGIQPPNAGVCWWGARAIYQGRSIDLLRDRQQMACGSLEEREGLASWLDRKALPELSARAARHDLPEPSSAETVVIQSEGFCLHASPRASFGYLYLGAWRLADE